jgi:cobalt-zinc-cadmium efflux system protein
MAAEVAGGILTGSLALLADAGHMLSDAGALGLSLFAAWIAERPPTPRRSYGYYRAEILAALANGAALIAIALWIVVEAAGRLGEPPEVLGGAMLAVACGGLAVNLASLWILGASTSGSLNLRGAWLHVFTDMLGSVAAGAAALSIWAFGWNWADPAASLLIAALVAFSAWGLVRESVAVLMESTPTHIDPDQVREAIAGVAGVRGVHDLHIWTITTGLEALSAHTVVESGAAPEEVLACIREVLSGEFKIDHVTIQFEAADCGECRAARLSSPGTSP